MDLNVIEAAICYTFKDKSILKRALTLASADNSVNNQTLEFFGDAILEFIVSEKIFDEKLSEGQLTERRKALVSDKALTPVSLKLGLDKYLVRGAGDTKNKKAVPSAYEALVAGVYLDGGMDEAKKFVCRTLDFSERSRTENYKGGLQEFLQANGESCPKYCSEDKGTPQSPLFEVSVCVRNKIFTGTAGSKQQAEQLAAKSALKYLTSDNGKKI